MITLKSNQCHFLLQALIYSVTNLTTLHSNDFNESFYIRLKIITPHIYNTFTVPCANFKIVSFASSKMKQILVLPGLSKFAVKLIC